MHDALFTIPTRNALALNLDYARKLTGDLTDEQAIAQPAQGINHPAWLLSHLCAYHPVAVALLRGETPDDPADHPFGMKSKPLSDPAAYKPLAELRQQFDEGHAGLTRALAYVAPDQLLAKPPIERWQPRFENVAVLLSYLLVRHEALHLGQLSAWRRTMNLPRV
jgi:hypothetical protein